MNKRKKHPGSQQGSAWKKPSLKYTNLDNPFNDVQLESAFVWHKKRDRDKKMGFKEAEQRRQREETDVELQKLRLLREEREKEREQREREMIRMQMESDFAQMGDWEAKENEVSS